MSAVVHCDGCRRVLGVVVDTLRRKQNDDSLNDWAVSFGTFHPLYFLPDFFSYYLIQVGLALP